MYREAALFKTKSTNVRIKSQNNFSFLSLEKIIARRNKITERNPLYFVTKKTSIVLFISLHCVSSAPI